MLRAGDGAYFKTFSGTENRWGDYSATVVDPVNDTDFWTIQEYAANPVGNPDQESAATTVTIAGKTKPKDVKVDYPKGKLVKDAGLKVE